LSIFELLLLAVGLAMDAFTVSVTNGILLKCPTIWQTLKTALFFGGFQALMPALGWLAGANVARYIAAFGQWIAFLLLGIIGAKMIYDSFHCGEQSCEKNPVSTVRLLVMALATSIDAFAVGLGLALLHVDVVLSCLFIGAVTFCICMAGMLIGKKLGNLFQKRAVFSGGCVLIAIGFKILITG
jgi:putative Mn2+ efflux pump MntP